MSSSGLVLPSGASVRAAQDTGRSPPTPLPRVATPCPRRRSPVQTASAWLCIIILLRSWLPRVLVVVGVERQVPPFGRQRPVGVEDVHKPLMQLLVAPACPSSCRAPPLDHRSQAHRARRCGTTPP